MLLQGLREPVSRCGCLCFALPVGLIPGLVVCIVCMVGFHENSEHWPSAGCAPDLGTLGLQRWVSVQESPALAILSCCMLISRNCGCLSSALLPTDTRSSLHPSRQCLGARLGNDCGGLWL